MSSTSPEVFLDKIEGQKLYVAVKLDIAGPVLQVFARLFPNKDFRTFCMNLCTLSHCEDSYFKLLEAKNADVTQHNGLQPIGNDH